jgi:hypothetical protein
MASNAFFIGDAYGGQLHVKNDPSETMWNEGDGYKIITGTIRFGNEGSDSIATLSYADARILAQAILGMTEQA